MKYCSCGNPLGDTVGNKCPECVSKILDMFLEKDNFENQDKDIKNDENKPKEKNDKIQD